MAQIVNSFSQSSVNFKVGLFGLLFTVLIHIIGFSTVYWLSIDLKYISSYSDLTSSRQGLWRACVCQNVFGSEVCACASLPTNLLLSWYKATQAMETLGLVGLILATCCSFATLFAPEQKVLRHFSVLLTLLSGVCILIGVGIFAGKAPTGVNLHYSFGLCCFSGALSIIVTILLYVGTRNMPNNSGLPAVNAGYVVSSAPPVVVYNQGQGQGQLVLNTVAQPGYPQAYPQEETQYIQGGYLKGQPAN